MFSIRCLTVAVFAWTTVALAADDPFSSFLRPGLDGSTVPHQVFGEGAYLLGGRSNVWVGAPDFLLRMDSRSATWPLSADGTPKLYARSIVLTDIGDAPDLAIRRSGPDNSPANGKPVPLKSGTNIGTLYWQGWGARCKGDENAFGFTSGCGKNGRNAAIYARTVAEQTGDSRAGSLHFATTPKGNPGEPVVRLEITSEGEIVISPDQNPATLRLSRPQTNGETAIVTAFQANGKIRINRVEIAAPNSCGKGYRCLRIRN